MQQGTKRRLLWLTLLLSSQLLTACVVLPFHGHGRGRHHLSDGGGAPEMPQRGR